MGVVGTGIASVSFKNIVPSHLPSFLLPCPDCGNRLVVRAVVPVPFEGGTKGSNLDDITYGCVQCSATLTRTVRTGEGGGGLLKPASSPADDRA